MHIDVLAGEQKVLDFGARGEVVFEWLVDILYEPVHSTCFTADIITVGEGGGCVCCADMFPQVWEFLFELIEHDFGFLLFELLIPFATVTHRCNCIVRGGPLGDLFIPHVSECSHPFRPPVVLALRVHRYHISSRPVRLSVIDIAPYTGLIFKMVKIMVEVRYLSRFQYHVETER